MTYKYNPQDIERTKEMLMVIGRTNLMATSKEEFGKIIDRDLKKNSVSKLKLLSDFSVSSIFHELENIVEVESDGLLSLEALITRYERSAIYYKGVLQSFFRSKQSQLMDKLYAMLDYIILTDTAYSEERNTTWDEQWDKALSKQVDFRIVLLMALGVLPAYSGKGMATGDPLAVTKAFIMGFVSRKDCPFGGNDNYYKAMISTTYNLDDRIASVVGLYKFCKIASLIFSVDLSRRVIANSPNIPGLDIDHVPVNSKNEMNDGPVLWWNEKVEHEFWYFDYIGNAYYLVKCNIHNRTYTKYTVFIGTELGSQISRILHPMSTPYMINGEGSEYITLASWTAERNNRREVQTITFNLIAPTGNGSEWTKEFRRFTLKQMRPTHRYYNLFAKNFERKESLWKLNNMFNNAFPGTSYFLSRSIYAVSKDYILVQDIKENPGSPLGFDLIPDKYYKVDKDLVDDDITLGDDIGILILGTDKPDTARKKYLSLDYCCTYLPIVDDEVQYP